MRRFAAGVLSLLLVGPSVALAQSQPPVAVEEQRTIVIVPADQIQGMQPQISTSTDHDTLWVAVPFSQFNKLQAGSASAGSASQPQANSGLTSAAPSQSMGRSLSSYIGQDKALLVVPADQLKYFSSTSADQSDMLVLMPYDRFSQIADTNAAGSPTSRERAGFPSGTIAAPLFSQDQVLLIVPRDQLKNFSGTTSCPNCQEPLVVMPLDQFNQVAQFSGEPTREQTSFIQPQTYQEEHRLVTLLPSGQVNAINEIFPVAGGRILVLQGGDTLLLPDSVTVSGGSALDVGAQVMGQYEEVNGQKVVTDLAIDESQGSHAESGNSGGS